MHASLADVIADTAQNSIEAGASRVTLDLVEDGETISVVIADNGPGMDADALKHAFEPSFTDCAKHPARPVGLGLPMLKEMCQALDGACSLESTSGVGTTLRYRFNARSPDLPPLGDVAGMVMLLFDSSASFEFIFRHRKGNVEYSFARSELADAVGSFETVKGLSLLKRIVLDREWRLNQVCL